MSRDMIFFVFLYALPGVLSMFLSFFVGKLSGKWWSELMWWLIPVMNWIMPLGFCMAWIEAGVAGIQGRIRRRRARGRNWG